MNKSLVLRGLATISFYATDHEAAKKWYSGLLGMEPYFNVPGYSEFRIGDLHQTEHRKFRQELSLIGMLTIYRALF
jgi:hypothetical protein